VIIVPLSVKDSRLVVAGTIGKEIPLYIRQLQGVKALYPEFLFALHLDRVSIDLTSSLQEPRVAVHRIPPNSSPKVIGILLVLPTLTALVQKGSAQKN
jgi:hypothetical protein